MRKEIKNVITFEEFQQKLVNFYIEINHFFKKHNITWFGHSGTMLGAVRHQGLIPWDDDIDMGMDYEDFVKNKELIKKFIEEDMNAIAFIPFEGKGKNADQIKFTSKEDCFVEYNGNVYITRPNIDVTLGVKNDFKHKTLVQWITTLKLFIFIQDEVEYFDKNYYLSRKSLKNWIWLKWVLRALIPSRIFNYFHKKTLSNNKGLNGIKLVYPWSWRDELYEINNLIEVQFETDTMLVPKNYDEVLTKSFKDWRKLPDKKNQIAKHLFYKVKK